MSIRIFQKPEKQEKKPQIPERKVSFEPSYCSEWKYKNWVTRILVSCVINHKMLWDSAHKSCHGPKAKLNANCFEKCCRLLTRRPSIHQSVHSLEGSSCLPQLSFPQSTEPKLWKPRVNQLQSQSHSRIIPPQTQRWSWISPWWDDWLKNHTHI